jgi:hypothetical protein
MATIHPDQFTVLQSKSVSAVTEVDLSDTMDLLAVIQDGNVCIYRTHSWFVESLCKFNVIFGVFPSGKRQ